MKLACAITFAMLAATSLQGCDGSRAEAPATTLSAAESRVEPSATRTESGRVRFGTAACDACLSRECNPFSGTIPLLAECVDAKCEQAFACFQRNHCASGYDTVNQCYCGKGVSNDECLSDNFKARGPCAALLNAANGSDDPRVVFGMMFAADRSEGDGAALFRCAAELCTADCVNDSAIPALGS